jgi:KaiC/GvpD/RAD55 family RecA-like ATPase
MAPLTFKAPPTPKDRAPIDVARAYIAAGKSVFPCHEATVEEFDPSTGEFIERKEKTPYTSNGLRGATVSQRIIDIWFGERHPNAMIGVPTGEPLGAWVLDIDVKELPDGTVIDGYKWLAAAEAEHGALPLSAAASTPRGGRHYYFKHVPGIRNRASFADGADTRGDGGYTCAPGSVMADGRAYRWLEYDGAGVPDFPDTPPWLLELVLPKPEPVQPRTAYEYTDRDVAPYVNAALRAECDRLASAPTGQRGHQLNASAYSLGQLVGAGVLSRADAEAELYAGAQANGVLAKDGERETKAKIKRGLDAGQKQPRQIPESANDNGPVVDTSRLLANAERKKAAAKEGNADAETEPAPTDPDRPSRSRFQTVWFDDIVESAPKVMFIKGAFGEREFTTVSGLPGTGKSVIVTDAACHVAAGMDWHGRRVRQGLVIYVAAERKKLTERRMMAFKKHHNVSQVPLLVIGGRLDFTSSLKDARDLIAAIKEAEIATGMECVWVIIDTLTRVFGAGDQNASKDMTRFVQSCDEILAETTAHVTAIHHSAWSGERGKGAIDLDGAVDASFMVKKSTAGSGKTAKYKLVCDGTNDGEEGDIVAFQMESVVLGQDEDGEPTTAPVVVPVAPERVPTSGRGYSPRVLAALSSAVAEVGIEPDGRQFPDGCMVVTEDQWRAAYMAAEQGAADTLRKQFKRGMGGLLEAGAVKRSGEWFYEA